MVQQIFSFSNFVNFSNVVITPCGAESVEYGIWSKTVAETVFVSKIRSLQFCCHFMKYWATWIFYSRSNLKEDTAFLVWFPDFGNSCGAFSLNFNLPNFGSTSWSTESLEHFFLIKFEGIHNISCVISWFKIVFAKKIDYVFER